MKQLIFILCLAVMIPISSLSQSLEKLPEEAAKLAEAYENSDKKVRTIHYPLMKESQNIYILTNDLSIKKLLEEFYDSANYYKVDYAERLLNLKEVIYVDADVHFLGEVSKDKTTIYLNSTLLNYKHLARVVFIRQMGKLYGLNEKGIYRHSIMSDHWEIDQRHEDIAEFTYNRPHQKKEFFDALHRKLPMKTSI